MTTPAPNTINLPALKPGWATTEFWLTVATTVISLLVGLGVVGPDFAAKHEDVVNALCLLAATIAPAVYAVARSIAKHGVANAVGNVTTTAIMRGMALTPPRRTTRLTGAAGLTSIGLIGAVLLIVGIVLAVVFHATATLLVIGLIVAVAGLLLLLEGPGRRLL